MKWVFRSLAAAERAREALRSSGYFQVTLDTRQDEAGPVRGNFLVGNGDASRGPRNYASNFEHVAEATFFVLEVGGLEDPNHWTRASEILESFGGVPCGMQLSPSR